MQTSFVWLNRGCSSVNSDDIHVIIEVVYVNRTCVIRSVSFHHLSDDQYFVCGVFIANDWGAGGGNK